MNFGSRVLAYHGCDEAVAIKLLNGDAHVDISDNAYDWLGRGAYFWENSPKRALDWAKFVHKNPQNFRHKIKTPFVVGAVIDLGNCLDLTDLASLEMVSAAYEQLRVLYEIIGTSLPENTQSHSSDSDLTKRFLDCAVFNRLHDQRDSENLPPFDTVRGVFIEGKSLYPGGKINAKTHIQISVLNPAASIIGYFKPRHLD